MGEFFKGWRRKIGVVTLVMACVFAAGWIRSFTITDEIWTVTPNSVRYGIASWQGGVEYSKLKYVAVLKPQWGRAAQPIGGNSKRTTQSPWVFHGRIESNNGGPTHLHGLGVPYWSIVMPLTLLSAWLLFSKPRQSTSVKITEPFPNEGA